MTSVAMRTSEIRTDSSPDCDGGHESSESTDNVSGIEMSVLAGGDSDRDLEEV